MSKKIIVAEKPSVARTYAQVLGVSGTRTDGYIENDEWIVTWCVGHLVTLSYPEEYDESLKDWSMDTLPFLPKHYKYHVIPEVKKQFGIVKSLYNRNDISEIYYAGDPAREGIYIQMLVRQMAGHNPNAVEKVVWIDSQTTEEIIKGVRTAKPLSAYKTLSDSGYMRAIEDYSIGINLSRALSLKYRNVLNTKSPIAVGRVMTCVLGMVVEREMEIEHFVPTKFHKVQSCINVNGQNILAEWRSKEENENIYSGMGFLDQGMAKSFAENLPSQVTIDRVSKTEEKKYAPSLFNQTELQAYCSKTLKISPDETLKIAQSLYDKKLTTYPRTSARVLSTAIAKEIDQNLNGLLGYSPETDAAIKSAMNNGTVSNIANTKYTDDSQVVDHYAIIPTGKRAPLTGLEQSVYDFIVRRFVSIFMPPAVYKKLKITEKAGKESFYATGSALVNPGFYAVAGTPKQSAGLPEAAGTLEEGQVHDSTYSILSGETKPPARYTSGSIVLAMENAGNLIEDEELRAQIKQSGIGTDATRAETIKKLVKINYIDLNTKTQGITPAPYGRCVYEIVKKSIPALLNPKITASWEKGLSAVADGTVPASEYLQRMETFVSKKIEEIKAKDASDPELDTALSPYKGAVAKAAEKKSGKGKKFAVNAEAYLNVPFDDKDKIKALGAWWDGERKAWYIPKGKDITPFKQWITDKKPAKANGKKTYLSVPYDDKDAAKSAGARWDGERKKWYMPAGADKSKFQKWL